jgi:adenine C2-methylase RlmN of 23S rRNA A2503 and tRNA A37
MGSSPARVRRFVEALERLHANVTVRDTRGRSIDAACGQLALAASS